MIDVSSSSVSNTRPAPNRSRRPLVTPYTPPLAATSSPKTTSCGSAEQRVGQRRVDGLGEGEAAGLLGQLPGAAAVGPAPRRRPPAAAAAAPIARATRTGRRGASGAVTSAGASPASARRAPPRRPGAPPSRPRRSGPPVRPGWPRRPRRAAGRSRPAGRGPGRRRSRPAVRYATSASAPACPIRRTIDRCSTAGRRSVRTHSAASAAASYAAARSHPSAAKYRSPGRDCSARGHPAVAATRR